MCDTSAISIQFSSVMLIGLGFIVQLVGFYILYHTSAKATFVKRKQLKYPSFSKAVGSLMIFASFLLFLISLGFGTGSLFGLISLMAISGCIIMLMPLKKA